MRRAVVRWDFLNQPALRFFGIRRFSVLNHTFFNQNRKTAKVSSSLFINTFHYTLTYLMYFIRFTF